jgi:inosine-uridine nucleoside N-ribohydrolase
MTDIIIDTDIGDDIDDAFALTFAARSPEVRLVGVTTVFRNACRRTQMAQALLEELGVPGVPVRSGCDVPLVEAVRATERDRFDERGAFIPCQHAGDYESRSPATDEHAVDFLVRMARESPGRITLVGIGPLTNIAMALRKAPDIASKLRSITLMGGVFGEQFPEWNILCDPEAAWIVIHSGAPLSMVGLDVTMRCPLPQVEVQRIAARGAGVTRLLDLWTRRWSEHSRALNPVLHDPLAVATLVDPSLVVFEQRSVEVALEGKQRGCTPTRKPAGPHGVAAPAPTVSVAVSVDAPRFTRLFMQRVLS